MPRARLSRALALSSARMSRRAPLAAPRSGRTKAASGAALEELADAHVRRCADARDGALDEPPAPRDACTRPLLERLPLKPRKWIAPGVWVAAVDTPHAPDNRVYLLSVAAGHADGAPRARRREFCTVLQGAYRDELGLFAAGDFAAADSDITSRS